MTALIEDRVKVVLATVLDNGTTADEIGPEADLVEQYGLDSLQTITFLLAIEDEFDLELDYPQLQLDDLRSVRQFSGFVERLASEAS
ncbi:acyl carrier protein [Kribbella sp. DT2]|uniref:acyl carrier protein n=1 Tax=Kribbella sp. DT2 TaxID=3393427 RepID=UPI003CF77BF0